MRNLLKQILPESLKNQIYIHLRKRKMKEAVKLSKTIRSEWTAEEAVDFLFSDEMGMFTPWQYKDELLSLAKRIEEKRPKTILEIGTASGGTLFLASLLATPDAKLISVDLPDGLFGGGYPDWKVPIYESISRANQSLTLIRDDSHAESTINRVKELLAGDEIEYLFIDGDHSYEGVKADFDEYSQLVEEGGLIAFHDIVPDKNPEPDHFVSVFWKEIKVNYEHFEFVRSWDQSKLGLGLLIKSDKVKASK